MNAFGGHVHAVGPGEWGLPVPSCEGWSVRSLVQHVVFANRWAAELFAGKTVAEVGDRLDGDLLGSDPVDAFDGSAAAAVRAVSADGALGRVVHVSFADGLTGGEYAPQLFADVLVHGWDLARAIGADDTLDPELMALCEEWFTGKQDWYRQGGAVGPRVDVPGDAGRQTRLLALWGRVG
ncbi:TIGR03086 family metal-binding protein [Actinomadura sp. BRA 177]|uniref:TIGR03086 family metal-binding protein n=1 Tax=Actinomadura sp. BRA 177 TaxID=2745202 RepID=UPI0020CE1924|nr:TIGR03086 family metal-binding protein [Actinomadura sp. BRA 177]